MSKTDFNDAANGPSDDRTPVEIARDALVDAVKQLDLSLSLGGDVTDEKSDAGKCFQQYRICVKELDDAIQQKIDAGPKLDKEAILKLLSPK